VSHLLHGHDFLDNLVVHDDLLLFDHNVGHVELFVLVLPLLHKLAAFQPGELRLCCLYLLGYLSGHSLSICELSFEVSLLGFRDLEPFLSCVTFIEAATHGAVRKYVYALVVLLAD